MRHFTESWEQTFTNGNVYSQSGQLTGNQYGGGQVSSGQIGTGHVSTSQHGSAQYGNGHLSNQYGGGQSSGSQFVTSQSTGRQFSNGAMGGGSNGATYMYNKTWTSSDSFGEDLTPEQQEQIRKALLAAARDPHYQGSVESKFSQGSYIQNGNVQGQNQNTYGQGGQGMYSHGSHSQGGYGQSQGSFESRQQSGYGQGNAAHGFVQGHGGVVENAGIHDQSGQVVRVRNKTIVFDENHNIISQTETSTEYGSLGHEGEAGSSFNT